VNTSLNICTLCSSYICDNHEITYQKQYNPYIEEEKKTQWPKDKVQKDKQQSTKHSYKTKDWITRTPLKTR
jgi:hypothetical protein